MDLAGFYTKLLHLHQTNKALWNGTYGGEVKFLSAENETNVLVFEREKDGNKVICVLNLSGKSQNVSLENADLTGKYKDLFSGKKVTLKGKLNFELKPWSYKVYYK